MQLRGKKLQTTGHLRSWMNTLKSSDISQASRAYLEFRSPASFSNRMSLPIPPCPILPPNNYPPSSARVCCSRSRGWAWPLGHAVPWILFIFAVFFALSYYTSYDRTCKTIREFNERYFSHSGSKQKVAIITIEGAIMHSDGFAKWQIDQCERSRREGGRGAGRFPRRNRHRQRLPVSPSEAAARRRAGKFRWWSAWAALRPAADITSRWPPATRPTPFSPSAPPGPVRLA